MIVDMIPPRQKGRPPEERFFDFCIPEPNSGCWLWIGGVASKGYGRFNIGNREQVQAHRFSWELHYGKIPDGLWALHRCDNPPCVNPEHLFLGTCRDNHQDMIQKGRKVTFVGEEGSNVRLTENQIEAIRLDPRRLRIMLIRFPHTNAEGH